MYAFRHENEARSLYSNVMKTNYSLFTIQASGLLLDPSNPFVGASPDGIIQCSCCKSGVLEIKCPYRVRINHLNSELMSIGSSWRKMTVEIFN